MPLGHPRSGAQWATAFMMSGVPWATGSVAIAQDGTQKIEFLNVTKFFLVSNTGGVSSSLLRVGFTLNGISGSNYYHVAPGEEREFDLRVRDLYLKATGSVGTTYDVVAGVTNISRNDFPNITGSNPAPTGSNFVPNIG